MFITTYPACSRLTTERERAGLTVCFLELFIIHTHLLSRAMSSNFKLVIRARVKLVRQRTLLNGNSLLNDARNTGDKAGQQSIGQFGGARLGRTRWHWRRWIHERYR